MSDNIKVAVRVRPFNERELNVEDARCIISMKQNGTTIHNLKPDAKFKEKQFFYDHSIWSFNEKDPNFVSQTEVYDKIGKVALSASFEGYNACIFAYGQTGSGKSYTMMGTIGDEKEEGLIPRLCNSLFTQIEQTDGQDIQFKTEVSYYEIYNEKVQDLLAAGGCKQILKVREHPKDGPYVENLTSCLVSDFSAIKEWMDFGNSHRSTAATMMNQRSSRSHAIFTIKMTMAQMQEEGPSEIISKMHLIDLAGSERAATSGATGERLKEGGNINRSLVTLGLVISKLAEESKSNRGPFVPYRDSVLTRLLKDSLGGNAKTFLIATVSPSELNYPESLSTLYFADNAKRVKNKPQVNEDPNVKLIKDLKKEIENLRQFIMVNQLQEDDTFLKEHEDMKEKLVVKESRIEELSKAWTVKWQETKKVIEDRQMAITSKGLKLYLGSQLPHLIELDPRSSQAGLVMYHIKKGIITVGKTTASFLADIELDNPDIMDEHCHIEYEDDIMLIPKEGLCAVNRKQIKEPVKLYHGDTILLGRACVLKFFDPQNREEISEPQFTMDELSDPEESIVSGSPPPADLTDLTLQAELALSKLNEDKDREIDRLSQQVKDLQEATKRYEDQMYVVGKELSVECSFDDDVFTDNEQNGSNRSNGSTADLQIYFQRDKEGAFIAQEYVGSLGTSPYQRISLLSSSGEDEGGVLTENDIPYPKSSSSSSDRRLIDGSYGEPSSSSSDDINTPTANRQSLQISNAIALQQQANDNRISMLDVEKIVTHEKKKLVHEHEKEVFKFQREKEAMRRQISILQKERESHVEKARIRLNSNSNNIVRRRFTSLSDQLIINCSIPYSHLVKKSFFSGTFHIYHVQIDVKNCETINIYRRYNEFKVLHDYLYSMYNEIEELFEFPPRRFLGNKAPAFVLLRRTLLERYMRKVLTYLSCKSCCAISAVSGELPTKLAVMNFHKFFREDETDRNLQSQSNTPVHHIN